MQLIRQAAVKKAGFWIAAIRLHNPAAGIDRIRGWSFLLSGDLSEAGEG